MRGSICARRSACRIDHTIVTYCSSNRSLNGHESQYAQMIKHAIQVAFVPTGQSDQVHHRALTIHEEEHHTLTAVERELIDIHRGGRAPGTRGQLFGAQVRGRRGSVGVHGLGWDGCLRLAIAAVEHGEWGWLGVVGAIRSIGVAGV